MEDLQMYSFIVKSSVHDYSIKFIDNTRDILLNELREGDFIIIDNNIIQLYKDSLEDILASQHFIGIDATEEQKSYQGITSLIEHLIENGFRKNHRLIAIGGGIIQDITAFISSIMYRGVSWIFFPTTLLSQGDSCIGSKTSINFGKYKNQVGGFYPPNKIFIDLNFLETLEDIHLKSGLGEMCHYFIIAGEADFEEFKSDYPKALKNKRILSRIIVNSLKIKKKLIEIDEFDENQRQIFNYGHSFGHAIESLTKYRVPHGIAVSYGMDVANFISVKLGYIPQNIRQNIRELLEKIWEDFPIKDIEVNAFKKALSKDKKNIGEELRLILNKGYGKIFKEAIHMDEQFTNWLKEYFVNEV